VWDLLPLPNELVALRAYNGHYLGVDDAEQGKRERPLSSAQDTGTSCGESGTCHPLEP
jgi:hypothetical protein